MANALKVKAKRNGYRRAGRGFSDTTDTILMKAELKPEQIEALTSDKNLIVSEIDYDAEAEAKAAEKAKAAADKAAADKAKK